MLKIKYWFQIYQLSPPSMRQRHVNMGLIFGTPDQGPK